MWAVVPPKGSKAKESFQLSAAQEKEVTDSLEEVVLEEEEREAARHRRPQRARRGC